MRGKRKLENAIGVHFHHIDGKPGAKRPRSQEEEQPSSSKCLKGLRFVQNEDQFQSKEVSLSQSQTIPDITEFNFDELDIPDLTEFDFDQLVPDRLLSYEDT
ncbi:hypothetical protein ACHQM5_025456 [Ranunculus cassubicifolius]